MKTNEPTFLSDLKEECMLWARGIALLFTSGLIPAVAALTALAIIIF